MTDTGPYTFGFLSQVTGISFPSGFGLFCVFGAFLQVGGTLTLNAIDLRAGPSEDELVSIAGLPVDPLILLSNDTAVPSEGNVTSSVYSGKSSVTSAPGNQFYFVQNFLAIRLRAPVTRITLSFEGTGAGANLAVGAAYLSSLDFASIISVPFSADTNLAVVNFTDLAGNSGNCQLVGPNPGWTGSMIKTPYLNGAAPSGDNIFTFTRADQSVTGP